MNIFSMLYQKVMLWSKHRRAPYLLAGLSFIEASVFPIPPDVMLAPMALAKPQHAWRYAALTTAASVLGGVFGYFIGWFFFNLLYPYIIALGYGETYQQVVNWFQVWGVWVIFIAGFSPIPYKLFTIAAGAVHMALLPFLIASTIGRAGRFFLVSGLMALGGEKMEKALNRYIDYIGWAVLSILLLAYVFFHFKGD